MATAITITAYQDQLGKVFDAIEADNFPLAHKELAKAEAQLNGLLIDNASLDGSSATLRKSLEGMRASLVDAEKRQSGGVWEVVEVLHP